MSPVPRTSADIGPIARLRAGRSTRRLATLSAGLIRYGVSLALMVRGALGLSPWGVPHSGRMLLPQWTIDHTGAPTRDLTPAV